MIPLWMMMELLPRVWLMNLQDLMWMSNPLLRWWDSLRPKPSR